MGACDADNRRENGAVRRRGCFAISPIDIPRRLRSPTSRGNTIVENYNGSDRRRNVLDIVADLGFLERKQQSSVNDAAVATEPVAPPALALVPSVKHDSGPVAPAASPAPADATAAPAVSSAANAAHADVMQALTDAQRR